MSRNETVDCPVPHAACRLPPELLIHIVDSVASASVAFETSPSTQLPVAYPACHPVTKTLLSLSLTCRTTYAAASYNLVRHCLYLDNSDRLRKFLSRLNQDEATRAPLPPLNLTKYISALYLSPFPPDTIDDWGIARWTEELLCILGPRIKSMIWDVPTDSLEVFDDHLGVLPILKNAIVQMTKVEEFVSVQDDLTFGADTALGTDPSQVVQAICRGGLRRLALRVIGRPYESTDYILIDMFARPNLQTIVLLDTSINPCVGGRRSVSTNYDFAEHPPLLVNDMGITLFPLFTPIIDHEIRVEEARLDPGTIRIRTRPPFELPDDKTRPFSIEVTRLASTSGRIWELSGKAADIKEVQSPEEWQHGSS